MHITREMVKEDLPGIIAQEGGSFVYEVPIGAGGTCRYEWEGKPSCLIGRYLVELGFPVEEFASFEGKSIDTVFLDGHMKPYGFTADPEAISAMAGVQYHQDHDYSWGYAYDRAFEN